MTERSEKIPLVECYGPVLQGEGPLVGTRTWFVRTGACDYLCTRCDSLHAVLPEHVGKARVMSAKAIADKCLLEMGNDGRACNWVTISGGNPAVWDLTDLCFELMCAGKNVAVETQGSIWKDWIAKCDSIAVSPKGPGMIPDWEKQVPVFVEFMCRLHEKGVAYKAFIKIPILTLDDVGFAQIIHSICLKTPMYLSVGNPDPNEQDIARARLNVLDWAKKVEEVVMGAPFLADVKVFPQQHVLVHGNARRR